MQPLFLFDTSSVSIFRRVAPHLYALINVPWAFGFSFSSHIDLSLSCFPFISGWSGLRLEPLASLVFSPFRAFAGWLIDSIQGYCYRRLLGGIWFCKTIQSLIIRLRFIIFGHYGRYTYRRWYVHKKFCRSVYQF